MRNKPRRKAPLRDRPGTQWFTVKGVSMTPLLREGDRIHFQPQDGEGFRLGDLLVLFRKGAPGEETCIVHRLLWTAGGRCWTRGDWIAKWDGPDWIAMGKVLEFERAGRLYPLEGPAARLASLFVWSYAQFFLALRSLYGPLLRAPARAALAWSVQGSGGLRLFARRGFLRTLPLLDRGRDAARAWFPRFSDGVMDLLGPRRASRTP